VELLQTPADRGYPADYLLARIKGRRAGLVRDWRPFIQGTTLSRPPLSEKAGSPRKAKPQEGIGGILMREYRWVYGQMNRELREIFHPFFLYAELRTVFACFRRIGDKKTGALDDLLSRSMLSETVKDVLHLSEDLKTAVTGIERLFSSLSPGFAGLTDVLETGGLRGVEQRLTERFLAETVSNVSHPVMKVFFSRLIDARNILSLAKYLWLELKTMPYLVPGGTIPGARLVDTARTDNFLAMATLIRDATGVRLERPEPALVERALYKGMTKWLKRAGRDPFGAAPILDYLWRCSIEAMNLNVLHYGEDIEREIIGAELVQ
jgi:vacuolar-type H+-ATPase subunit C/Vma6